ncbi:MAG: SPOR domain-containing protein [Bacteroidetes bacterium]|nr:SPOR domain-containing protein [Bacteroidota bacterium]
MLKYAALLFNTIALLIYQFFFADGITVTQKIPQSAKPDSEFTVELTINKGTVGGFAKLQQDLPEGFTAIQDDNNGASFTFTNQSVKYIWMSLPSDKEFKIRYKVKVAAGINGDKIIAGKFSYVSDNVKQSIDIAPSTITIGEKSAEPIATATTTTEPPTKTPDPVVTTPVVTNTNPVTTTTETVVTTPVVTNTSTTTTEPVTTTSPSNQEPSSITCFRTVPSNAGENFTVEILVNKGNVTGFAKLLDVLPAGFTATAGDLQGASFSFADQKAKFVWVSMPSQTEFKITYKVAIAAGTSGPQKIDGVFSFIENDETKKFVIATSSITVGTEQIQTIATNTTTTTEPIKTNNTTETTTTTSTTNNTNAVNTNNTTATNSATTTENTKSLSATNTIPAPQGNVNYKVQIAALHNAVNANVLATRYNISSKVNTEMGDGFTKYTVGSHNDYKEARDAREDVRNKGVVGPFVTAYNSGKRITVQEALMITSQKWFR